MNYERLTRRGEPRSDEIQSHTVQDASHERSELESGTELGRATKRTRSGPSWAISFGP